MTATILVVLLFSVAVAAFVQASSGLGFALLLGPILGFLAPGELPTLLLELLIPLNAYVVWRERGHLDRSGLSWITAGRVVGAGGGLWLLVALPESALAMTVGAVTVLAALATLLSPAFAPTRVSFVAAGTFSGMSETATGIGGPPLALVYQHRPAPVLRATVAMCGLIGEVISLAVLGIAGRAPGDTLVTGMVLLPPLIVGAAVSNAVHRRVTGPAVRILVLTFAVVSGSVLMIRG